MDSVERMLLVSCFYVFPQDIEKPWDCEDNQDGFLKKPARERAGTSIAFHFVRSVRNYRRYGWNIE